MKKDTALLIVNPKAGQCKAKNNLFGVIEAISSRYLVTVHLTESGEDATLAAREGKEKYDVIFCCGGDGTLSRVVNGCADPNDPPIIGYIPCGTANDVASTLNLPKNMPQCAKKIMCSRANPHDIGIFNGERRFVYIASFGAFTRSSYETPQAVKNALGQSAYLISGAMELGNIQKITAKVVCDGREMVYDDIALLSIANTKSAGGIVKIPDNRVALNDGRLELLIVRYPTSIGMWNDIISAVSMQIFDSHSENVILLHGSHFEITTRESIAWTLDGENAGEYKKVTIDCAKSAVKLIY